MRKERRRGVREACSVAPRHDAPCAQFFFFQSVHAVPDFSSDSDGDGDDRDEQVQKRAQPSWAASAGGKAVRGCRLHLRDVDDDEDDDKDDDDDWASAWRILAPRQVMACPFFFPFSSQGQEACGPSSPKV